MNTLQILKSDDMQVKWKTVWYTRHLLEQQKEVFEKVKKYILELADKIKNIFKGIIDTFRRLSEDNFKFLRNKLGIKKKLSTFYPQNVNNYVNNVNKKVNTKGYTPSFIPRCRSMC